MDFPTITAPEVYRPHIVVIDDEEELCELITIRLEHNGYRVSSERSCRGALEILEREVVDAMLLDLRLDGENGLDLLVEVQKRVLDLPVIILTAHGTIETAVQAMKAGAYGFLTKPFDDRELTEKIAHAVEHVRLRREVAGLRRIVGDVGSDRLLGTSAAISTVRDVVARVAPSEATVLILGESGTGKEVAARSIHALSPRKGPFIAINCGALPAELLESELFGHRRGAFTGASRDKDGLFAAADKGTLLLDEIGDAPPSVQVKLLRVLQERSYTPVGATDVRATDVRVIAATNRDLRADMEAGRFREDLFYRLHVVPVVMPPLRDRREDIPLLAELFLTRAAAQHKLSAPHLSHEALRILMAHSWPGNVRELANVVEGAALLSNDGVLRPNHVLAVLPKRGGDDRVSTSPANVDHLPGGAASVEPNAPIPPMREAREAFDRAYLEELLKRSGGNVSAAARTAGRNRTDFYELLHRYALNPADFRA
ncbi:MAG: Response regulator of zinc sigma-54-dependent two-component system [Myxococcaceae bacterium]|nr:Response regulator of zinc sigma-54-dependent two-component system [Myxococcaceae bacterium]